MNQTLHSLLPGHSGDTLRPRVAGKFLFIGEAKLWIKGTTYGTFKPEEDGTEFPPRAVVERDFEQMAAAGINTVRTYIPPPIWLLDIARQFGLRVMVGLAWEQHITFLDQQSTRRTIERRIREGVAACNRHPAVLCYTLGNEIPPSIVRWHQPGKIERFLKKLYEIAKSEDPEGLVTYVNYPTTEYLHLPFLDFHCFNVYLEKAEVFADYLARLQNLVDEKPLVMAEIGLDSRSNGLESQAETLDWQLRTAFEEGCAGTFVFSWTDEWYRGGHDIDDWDFGLTTRDRQPKPALETVSRCYSQLPFPERHDWPKVSVVVCSYNGANTIRDTMEGLKSLEYPNFEVIVVNDGSTDDTPTIASEYDVTLISTENRGLSAARNTGWQEASGTYIAYIDDDAYPDPHWLHYIVHTFENSDFVGVGGPNIAPPGDGPIAECVYNAPGGPVQVLLDDREAEHIPGCNMVFRRDALAAIDGFDHRYRAAGDDVDLCWRLQDNGGRIGFHAAAMDWHHRRNSLSMYWNQQKGYGKAEALLEEKWPEKYNALGHYSWSGRLYGRGLTEALKFSSARVYGGQWGSALFQSLYQPAQGVLSSLPLMPEWYLVVFTLGAISLLGFSWNVLFLCVPLLVLAVSAMLLQAGISASRAVYPSGDLGRLETLKLRAITAMLHLLQPLARLVGRLNHGLTPWRQRVPAAPAIKRKNPVILWSEQWQSAEEWLTEVTRLLRDRGISSLPGGDFDTWDISVRASLFGGARLQLAIEEHGAGKQLLRFRCRPSISRPLTASLVVLGALSAGAALSGAVIASSTFALTAGALAYLSTRSYRESASSLQNAIMDLDHCVEPGDT